MYDETYGAIYEVIWGDYENIQDLNGAILRLDNW